MILRDIVLWKFQTFEDNIYAYSWFHKTTCTCVQVYTIPRVGKSLDSSVDEDDYSENVLRSEEERQVFSKIPRVGRRSIDS